MQIGAAIYGYRHNFNCSKPKMKTKAKSTKIKLFNLIIDGYRTASNLDDDYFVSIAQYLMKKGYPSQLSIDSNTGNLDKFFMQSLFSICPFHWQSLMINYQKFNVFDWRKQFDLFNEIKISELNYYRNRASMPLTNFSSLADIYRIIFTKYGKYNEINEQLKFKFNSSWDDAIWILAKHCIVAKDRFIYKIEYGCKDDYDNLLKGSAHSSWSVTVESEINENYADFCIRLHDNYDEIISGSKEVLISERYQNDEKNFYLGGHFKLRTVFSTEP